MKISEAIGLVAPRRRGAPNQALHRLTRCHSIDDLHRFAQRRLPRAVFDYVDGAADGEETLQDNVRALRGWNLQPRALQGTGTVDLTTTVLGVDLPVPIGLAPTGYSLLAHPGGESAAARAAAAHGVPYSVSNVSTTSVTALAATGASIWTQLYLCRDRGISWDYLQAAWDTGSRVLEVSVDTAVSGNRLRDQRNGLTIPPSIALRTLADIALHPAYWTGVLRGPAFRFANIGGTGAAMTVASMTDLFDPTLSWDDIDAVRSRWPGAVVLKGPLDAQNARRAVDAGITGVYLSNHGGRQLDRCTPPVQALPKVRHSVGEDVPVLVDSGVRHGSDVAVLLALGADLVMLGRAYLYGLAAAGQAGVSRALDIVTSELTRTMQLLGVGSVAELQANAASILVPRNWQV